MCWHIISEVFLPLSHSTPRKLTCHLSSPSRVKMMFSLRLMQSSRSGESPSWCRSSFDQLHRENAVGEGKEDAVSELLTSTSPSQATTEQSLLRRVHCVCPCPASLHTDTLVIQCAIAHIEDPMSPSAGNEPQCHSARFRWGFIPFSQRWLKYSYSELK